MTYAYLSLLPGLLNSLTTNPGIQLRKRPMGPIPKCFASIERKAKAAYLPITFLKGELWVQIRDQKCGRGGDKDNHSPGTHPAKLLAPPHPVL